MADPKHPSRCVIQRSISTANLKSVVAAETIIAADSATTTNLQALAARVARPVSTAARETPVNTVAPKK